MTDPESENSQLNELLALMHAAVLAADGRLDEADNILSGKVSPANINKYRDLTARIHVQRGQYEQARNVWNQILQDEPNNAAAKEALHSLDGFWRYIRPLGIMAGALVVFAIIGLATVGRYAMIKKDSSGNGAVENTVAMEQNAEQLQLGEHETVAEATNSNITELTSGIPEVINETPAVETTTHQKKSIELPAVDGFTTRENGDSVLVVPSEGIFTYRCELNQTATERLQRLSTALQSIISNVWVVIHGHTDSDPMSPNSLYANNRELALDRAVTAANILSKAGLPVYAPLGDMSMEPAPPYEEIDYEAKLKNRTVTIELIPR